ncbi:MAG: PTS sugar transporter subunit IIA [Endomicrobium sp.]|jgi:mannose/fructose/sorbose-specific phosphotransferase system IIA component|nr:PTS sugar transporter subunit IIA [Endomicrobium sp.]
MIKIVIVAHGELAQELLAGAELIAGKQPNLHAVKRGANDSLVQLQERINSLLQSINDGDGTLILTDMVGGTPCNAAAPLCATFNTEVIAGVNLPMILSAVFSSKTAANVSELADKVLLDGQKSIINIKKMLLSRMK